MTQVVLLVSGYHVVMKTVSVHTVISNYTFTIFLYIMGLILFSVSVRDILLNNRSTVFMGVINVPVCQEQ